MIFLISCGRAEGLWVITNIIFLEKGKHIYTPISPLFTLKSFLLTIPLPGTPPLAIISLDNVINSPCLKAPASFPIPLQTRACTQNSLKLQQHVLHDSDRLLLPLPFRASHPAFPTHQTFGTYLKGPQSLAYQCNFQVSHLAKF